MNASAVVGAMLGPAGLAVLGVDALALAVALIAWLRGREHYDRFYTTTRPLRALVAELSKDAPLRRRLENGRPLDLDELERALDGTPVAARYVASFAAFVEGIELLERLASLVPRVGLLVGLIAFVLGSSSAAGVPTGPLAAGAAAWAWGVVGGLLLGVIAQRCRKLESRGIGLATRAVREGLSANEDLQETVTGEGMIAGLLEEGLLERANENKQRDRSKGGPRRLSLSKLGKGRRGVADPST
ncbi:hypothetical protein [Plesiocystis pacifica]|nr:hypothetical protein [Plesiocystis pacifica]